MSPSMMSKTTVQEATKHQASTPNFVLSLLAACSTSVPSAGNEGEEILSAQLSALLKDKAMAVDELNLLYSYRFGFSMYDALKFTGFNGKLQEFLEQQKEFHMEEGRISLVSAALLTLEGMESDTESVVEKECGKGADDDNISDAETESTTDAESCSFDSDSEVDVGGWSSVGNRLSIAFSSEDKPIPDASAEFMPDAESCFFDSDSDVDITGWSCVGNRLATAFRSDGDHNVDVDVGPWKAVGGRVAAVLRSDEEVADPTAWRDVGSRLLVACKRSDDEEDDDPEVLQWHSVGARVLRSLDCLHDAVNDI